MNLVKSFVTLVAVLVFSCLAITYAGLHGLRETDATFAALTGVDMPRLQHVSALRDIFRSEFIAERDLILEVDPDAQAALGGTLANLDLQFGQRVAAYRQVELLEDDLALRQLIDIQRRWVDVDADVRALMAAGKPDQGRAASYQHGNETLSWEEIAGALVEHNEQRLAAKTLVAEGHSRSTRFFLLGAAALAIGLALSVGALILLEIHRNVQSVLSMNANLEKLVNERTRALADREAGLRLILDNAGQGFLTVGRDGQLRPEHSTILTSWFGPSAGGTLWGYLAGQAPREAAWIEALWENVSAGLFPIEVSLAQLPARVALGERTLSLSYRAIAGAGDDSGEGCEQVLVVVSDVTAQMEQERAKLDQRELLSVFQWMRRDRSGLVDYFAEANRLVRAILDGPANDLAELKRHLHTLKGNSGLFGLSSVAEVCQQLETSLADLPGPLSPADRTLLAEVWVRAQDKRLGLFGEASAVPLEIHPDDYQRLLNAVIAGAPLAELEAMVRALALEPATQRLTRLGEQARALARRLEKGEITVRVEGNDVRLPGRSLPEFWGNFAHLIRNAVDHGLEPEAERKLAGKSAAGALVLRTAVQSEQLIVEVEDDGRGIDWSKLIERSRAAGLPAQTREDLVAALFHGGVSTKDAVTDIAGRGVGMNAVYTACKVSGGTVRVQSEPGAGTRFQFVWPASVLRGAPGVPEVAARLAVALAG